MMDLSPKLDDLSLSSAVAKSDDPSKSNETDRLANYNPAHPEGQVANLIWAPDGEEPANYKELRADQGLPLDERCSLQQHEGKRYELCWVCGWTERHQIFSSYCPRVKIFHSRHNMALWDIGGQWVLRDQPNDASKGNDLMTQKFLRAQPGHSIPLIPQMLELSGPSDTVELTLMSQARGAPLSRLWGKLSKTQRDSYVQQMAAIIRQLRNFTRPTAQKVDGSLLDDFLIGNCLGNRPPSCTKIGSTSEDWLDALAPTMRGGLSRIHRTTDPTIIEAELQKIRANFPSGGPYYLTHGDLNLTNIFVLDDKIEAIIDWEMAGYYPWWVERYNCFGCNSPAEELFDPVWAKLEPELDHPALLRAAWSGVLGALKAWEFCIVQHPGEDNCWYRPAFSACEAAAGSVSWRDCGNQPEHQICDVQWGVKSPEFLEGLSMLSSNSVL